MNRKVRIAGLALSGFLAIVPSIGATPRVIFRPSFGYPGYYGYYGYGYYPRPIYPRSVFVVPNRSTGEVKIDTKSKEAGVYVDGAYLGPVRKFKKFNLKPGTHAIELWDAADNSLFHEEIAIVPGKTTRINAMGIAG